MIDQFLIFDHQRTSPIGSKMRNVKLVRKLTDFGVEPLAGTTEQMANHIKTETARWHALIKERQLTLD
ncbi:hypothetical protein D3870_05890 [Noviherbaspirillum cavernae]|uniref:Uncharacterized protein n=1 Tax=Noviherbaspirillum cavernae TaxID=2320862 RepID=A0A418WZU6_9BURK|nr:hypothetical protein D3870_05890 [Noviherbaspirillum cavernae]